MKKGTANWTSLVYHSLLFGIIHLLLGYIYGIIPESELPSGSYQEHVRQNFLSNGVNIYEDVTLNRISSIWKSVLIIHLIWELIETFFPRKKKEPEKMSQQAPEVLEQKKIENNVPMSSKRAWSYVIVAGLLEIIWASGLKYEEVPAILVIAALIISFEMIIKATKALPIGTTYAVFTGIGTIGTVIVEAVVLGGSISLAKVCIILLLLVCVIGLKLTSGEGRKP